MPPVLVVDRNGLPPAFAARVGFSVHAATRIADDESASLGIAATSGHRATFSLDSPLVHKFGQSPMTEFIARVATHFTRHSPHG